MKTINGITVKVTYTVSLGNIEVDNETFKAICNSYDNGSQLGSDCWLDDEDAYEASDWLSDHIRESDAMDWEYEIEELNVDD